MIDIAKEQRRSKIVAMLRGYVGMEYGDTATGLIAEFEALVGEPYKTQEEESAENVQAVKEQRQQRIEAQLDTDRQIIADAVANGFMQCRAIRDALGWDRPNSKGVYHSSLQVALHWIEKAGEEVVFLIPDGITNVTKSERTGCYPDVFERVLAAKNEYYAALDARDAKSWADAEEAKAEFDRQKAESAAHLGRDRIERDEQRRQSDSERDARLYVKRYNELIGYGLEPDYVTEALGEPPEGVDTADLNTPESHQESTEAEIIAAMRAYTGPMNKRGTYPKGEFMGLRGKAKRELWDRRNE